MSQGRVCGTPQECNCAMSACPQAGRRRLRWRRWWQRAVAPEPGESSEGQPEPQACPGVSIPWQAGPSLWEQLSHGPEPGTVHPGQMSPGHGHPILPGPWWVHAQGWAGPCGGAELRVMRGRSQSAVTDVAGYLRPAGRGLDMPGPEHPQSPRPSMAQGLSLFCRC